MYLDDYLIEKNGESDFVKAIIEQYSIMPECSDTTEMLEKLEKWIEVYRYENNITEYLDFPCLEDLDDE